LRFFKSKTHDSSREYALEQPSEQAIDSARHSSLGLLLKGEETNLPFAIFNLQCVFIIKQRRPKTCRYETCGYEKFISHFF
jgi:hypothetical protein